MDLRQALCRRRPHGEGLTIALACVIYASWVIATWSFAEIPAPLRPLVGGWLIAWHGSLQHEAIHGHPTRSARLNGVIAGPPLALWLPFVLYRDSHLAHHRAAKLTDPASDPESFYMSTTRWNAAGILGRALAVAHQTLLGRVILGPAVLVASTYRSEARRLPRTWRTWAIHGVAVTTVLGWTWGVCGIDPLSYIACFVYPGLALTLMRSFAEHRPGHTDRDSTNVVDACFVWRLLFFNNNLHVVHHRYPGRPWYAITRRDAARIGAGVRYRGYAQLWWRYGVRPKDDPVHTGRAAA